MRQHCATRRYHPRKKITTTTNAPDTEMAQPDLEKVGTGLKPVGNLISELTRMTLNNLKPKKPSRRKYIF